MESQRIQNVHFKSIWRHLGAPKIVPGLKFYPLNLELTELRPPQMKTAKYRNTEWASVDSFLQLKNGGFLTII